MRQLTYKDAKMNYKIDILETSNGVAPFVEWLETLDIKNQARINNRISRLKDGNFGDHCSVGDKIFELRFFFGPGYRVYYGLEDDKIVILISGGDKKSQKKDIKKAKELWNIYIEEENQNEEK